MSITPENGQFSATWMPVRRMREEMRHRTHRWAVILESRNPGRRSASREAFLTQAQERIGPCVSPQQTLLLLQSGQDPLQTPALDCYPAQHVFAQPEVFGTLPRMLWSLAYLADLDAEAVVVFFPARGPQADEHFFFQGVTDAFSVIESRDFQDSVVILGTSPRQIEPDCEWIEPKPSILGCSGGMVRPILRFWDSPAPQSAHDLQQRGCLLNTSVMIGRVAVFLELFESVWKRESPRPSLETISARLSAVDCSSLLKANAARLLVLPVREQSFSTGP